MTEQLGWFTWLAWSVLSCHGASLKTLNINGLSVSVSSHQPGQLNANGLQFAQEKAGSRVAMKGAWRS
jgi:hypothetical protein